MLIKHILNKFTGKQPPSHDNLDGTATGKQSPSHSNSDDLDLNHTIECLLNLRSVRDQFADAGLNLSSGELAEQLDILEDELIDHLVAQRKLRDGVGLLTVAVVGDFNSGKSTFINALLGKDLCPVGEEPTTSSVTHFIHGDHEHIEQELPNGKRKPLKKSKYRSLVRHNKMGDAEPYIFHIFVDAVPLTHIRLVDTPGFNAPPPNTNDTRVTENAIKEADVLFVLMDIRKGNPTKSLLDQLSQLQQNGKDEFCPPMFLLLNKAEELPPSQRTEVKKFCETQYGDQFRNVTLVSALQLNDSDNSAPFDTLQTTTQQIRDAIMRRDPFETLISAEVLAEKGPAIYRMNINGNIYEIPPLSGSILASREELYETVRYVEAERHVLLEMQFQRKTTQLREDWQEMLAKLDDELKLALREYTGVAHGTDDTKSKALEEIDKAKDDILDMFCYICTDVIDEIITKNKRTEEGFWSDTNFYQINVHLDKMDKIAADHDYLNRIADRYNRLLSSLTRLTDISADLSQNELAEEIKEFLLECISNVKKEIKKDFGQYEFWGADSSGNHWQIEYQDDESVRDEHYTRISSYFREKGNEWILIFTQAIQGSEIDRLQEAIISDAEQSRARDQDLNEELDRLQQRIDELKEHTP